MRAPAAGRSVLGSWRGDRSRCVPLAASLLVIAAVTAELIPVARRRRGGLNGRNGRASIAVAPRRQRGGLQRPLHLLPHQALVVAAAARLRPGSGLREPPQTPLSRAQHLARARRRRGRGRRRRRPRERRRRGRAQRHVPVPVLVRALREEAHQLPHAPGLGRMALVLFRFFWPLLASRPDRLRAPLQRPLRGPARRDRRAGRDEGLHRLSGPRRRMSMRIDIEIEVCMDVIRQDRQEDPKAHHRSVYVDRCTVCTGQLNPKTRRQTGQRRRNCSW